MHNVFFAGRELTQEMEKGSAFHRVQRREGCYRRIKEGEGIRDSDGPGLVRELQQPYSRAWWFSKEDVLGVGVKVAGSCKSHQRLCTQ